MKIIVMGVSGVGKSAVGAALAAALHLPFIDGDDLHPPANCAKMAAGLPLTDEDRWPWLTACAAALADDAVLACSALKRRYRDHLRVGVNAPLHMLYLTAPRSLIAKRLTARQGHFMPASLLDSQLAALEAPGPDEATSLDATESIDAIVARALATLPRQAPRTA